MLKITTDGLWETISKANSLIGSKLKQVNIIVNNFTAESFVGGNMDNFPKGSTSAENNEVVWRHQRTGDRDMDHSVCSTKMLLDIIKSWCNILILSWIWQHIIIRFRCKTIKTSHPTINCGQKFQSTASWCNVSAGNCYTESGIKILSLLKSPCLIILHTDPIFQRISPPLDLSSQRAAKSLLSSLNNPWTWLKLCSIRWCWMNDGSIVLAVFSCIWLRTVNHLWFSSATQFKELSLCRFDLNTYCWW